MTSTTKTSQPVPSVWAAFHFVFLVDGAPNRELLEMILLSLHVYSVLMCVRCQVILGIELRDLFVSSAGDKGGDIAKVVWEGVWDGCTVRAVA